MTKINFSASFAAIIFALTACKTNIKEPEQIGKQGFTILKNLSTKSKAEYVSDFMSIEEIRELGKNAAGVDVEKTRKKINSMRRQVGEIEGYYNDIKEKGGQYGINWQEIEYLDFVYEIKVWSGIKGCYGSLYFKYKDSPYNISVTSIFDGREYKLLKIRDLHIPSHQ